MIRVLVAEDILHAGIMASARSQTPLARRDWTSGWREDENRIATTSRSRMPGAVIRVLVAEDVRVLRETLVALLSLEEDIEVVAALAALPENHHGPAAWLTVRPLATRRDVVT